MTLFHNYFLFHYASYVLTILLLYGQDYGAAATVTCCIILSLTVSEKIFRCLY